MVRRLVVSLCLWYNMILNFMHIVPLWEVNIHGF